MPLLRTINPVFRPSISWLRLPCSSIHRPVALQLRHNVLQRSNHNISRRSTNGRQDKPSKPPRTYFQEKASVKPQVIIEAPPADNEYGPGHFPRVKVQYLRPAIWAIFASWGIYEFLAYLEAKKQLKNEPRRNPFEIRVRSRESAGPQEVLSTYWKQLDSISQLGTGIIGANVASHLGGMLVPGLWQRFWHTPARNVSYTLLTSTFVHSGAMHLGFNMYCGYNFIQPVGHSRLFDGNAYHLLSFYLGTGILSGFAQHWSTAIARQTASVPPAFIPSGGASGAIFGILAVFCMQYPDAGLGIIFLPFSIPALYALPGVMAFDLAGVFGAFPKLHLGHAAHFSGAMIGICYSLFNGKEQLWNPLVERHKKRLQKRKS
ncbi:hypothetical protein P154DRAFT_503860 [Amniculicola lignicola CBS 123094]|uniref:Peptidase S54 rhomboid domain-containing protein n=1 Tax=Amniculicola lignicola CBS 123094 TaxID=1392246 RepID=A0A6A5W6E7_9PLEO|nr:hypothetical protein P154DRAFT_503860 [Amniculicola lignicola CBS 123094]